MGLGLGPKVLRVGLWLRGLGVDKYPSDVAVWHIRTSTWNMKWGLACAGVLSGFKSTLGICYVFLRSNPKP